jgi:L-threonylcarbamoyladenylate synthase
MMTEQIEKAVSILQQGGLVAFPTETVYGLGADASNPDALRLIFAAKQRPVDHPLIVHISSSAQLSEWARDIPESALLLAKTFWPGPLTLIFKKTASVSDLVTGQQDTVGLRVPQHPVAQALLKAFKGGLAAPSANRFGRISPTTAEAVREELGGSVDLILDGGQCDVGVESTIVDVSGAYPVVLRPGMISVQQIEEVLQQQVSRAQKNSPRVSGSLESHYAPRTLTQLIHGENIPRFLAEIPVDELPVALLSHSAKPIAHAGVEWITMSDNSKNYAHDLYRTLRELDKKNLRKIIIESVPADAAWDAIRDRLQRASK